MKWRHSCRPKKAEIHGNTYSLAKIGSDTAETGAPKITTVFEALAAGISAYFRKAISASIQREVHEQQQGLRKTNTNNERRGEYTTNWKRMKINTHTTFREKTTQQVRKTECMTHLTSCAASIDLHMVILFMKDDLIPNLEQRRQNYGANMRKTKFDLKILRQ